MMCLLTAYILIQATVTQYTAIETCPMYPDVACIMANGEKPIKDNSLACPRSIKLGTRAMIEGKWYTCSDRTAKRLDGRFDIFAGYTKQDHNNALEYGKQDKYILIDL